MSAPVRPVHPVADRRVADRAAEDRLETLRGLVRLLDGAVRIPGTSFRFGLDALIGLVPGIGDVAGAALSGFVVLAAIRVGVPAAVLLRMLLNVGIDMAIGAVPLAGDLFDFAWRANARNLALLERTVADPRGARRSSGAIVAVVLVGLLVLLAAGAWLAFVVGRWIVERATA
jgi:hypothetical protein